MSLQLELILAIFKLFYLKITRGDFSVNKVNIFWGKSGWFKGCLTAVFSTSRYNLLLFFITLASIVVFQCFLPVNSFICYKKLNLKKKSFWQLHSLSPIVSAHNLKYGSAWAGHCWQLSTVIYVNVSYVDDSSFYTFVPEMFFLAYTRGFAWLRWG